MTSYAAICQWFGHNVPARARSSAVSLVSAAYPATAEHLFVFAAGSPVRLELDTD